MRFPTSSLAARGGRVLLCGALAPLVVASSGLASEVPATLVILDSPDGDPVHQTVTVDPRFLSFTPTSATENRGLTLDAQFVLTGELPEGDSPSGVVFTPDGTRIVAAHRESGNLVVFDAVTRAVVQTIAVSGSPAGVAVSSDGVHAVVPNMFEDTASIVDLGLGSEIAVVDVGDQPGAVRISPDGLTAVVGNTVDASLSIIDIGSATELRRIPGTGFVASVSFAPESGAVAVAFSSFEFVSNTEVIHPDFFADQVHLVDITTGSLASLGSSDSPRNVAVTPGGLTAVVSHTGTDEVISVIDPAGPTITKTIAIGTRPWGSIAVNPSGTKAAVAVQNNTRIVNLVTDVVSGDLATASVNEMYTTADGNYALTVGFRGSLLDYATETLLANLNNIVSTALGAVSPAGPRGAMIATTFGEDMVVVNTSGAAGFTEGVVPSGPPPEGDKARMAALCDAQVGLVTSVLSDNATIVDALGGTVDDIVDVGDRPAEAEITPDCLTGVVANLDSNFLSVIDLGSADVTNITISRRASQVEISPDGQFAYVAVVADGDGVWRVNLQSLSVQGPKLITGNMGGVGFFFSQTSGLTLSHDGAALVTCNSFSNSISVIDTGSWSVVATVPVGAFPVRAIFARDDSEIYVTNRDGDQISIVANLGGASAVTGTVFVGDSPFEMELSPDGQTLYVLNFNDDTIGVVDLATEIMTRTIPLPDRCGGFRLDDTGQFILAATGNSSVAIGPGPRVAFSASGELSAIFEGDGSLQAQVDVGVPASMMTPLSGTSIGAFPSPLGDGVFIFDFDGPLAVGAGGIAVGPMLAMVGPHPATRQVALRYQVPDNSRVELTVHDAAGRRVATLVDDLRPSGTHVASWDGRDHRGAPVGAGVYFARLRAGTGSGVAAKVVLAR